MRKALLAAATIFALSTTVANASPAADLSAQTLDAYPSDPCVAGGPTAADGAAATRLNKVLTNKLRNAMTAYRVSCARVVIDTVQQYGLDERAAVIAITTTIVESTIMNINVELDHDSLGLFQQRANWGTKQERLNPVIATRKFLHEMERVYPNGSWRTAPIGKVCDDVQHSAFPQRYQVEAADAQRIVDELAGPAVTTVGVYGALADGRMSYSTINPDNGNRTKTLVSGDNLGFTPKTLATLNFNTVLVTSADGGLFRVDIVTNKNSLQFDPPVRLSGGWTHTALAYDGHGHLYGIAGSKLISYVVSRDKPTGPEHIGQRVEIGSGFTLRTLTATGDDWLLGISTTGVLRSYHIKADYSWDGDTLGERWSGIDQLVSPGYGLYYGQTRDGGMYRYYDPNPFDLNGSDIRSYPNDPVDTSGWTQILLSAQPFGT